MRILIVEDNRLIRQLIPTLLNRLDFEWHHATNGIEAIDKFFEVCPDAVLMDIRMPKMDGVEAARIIKQSSPDTPIAAVSAYSDKHTRERAAGVMDRFIVKNGTEMDRITIFLDEAKHRTRKVKMDDNTEALVQLIRLKRRRFDKLRQQQARLGDNTPPEILNEIEDLEAEIDDLQGQL